MSFLFGVIAGFCLAVAYGAWAGLKKVETALFFDGDDELAASESLECLHPESAIQNFSSIGHPQYRCKLCGAESASPFPSTN